MTSIIVGGTQYSPQTGDYGSGTDFTSPFVVHTNGSNVTGAIGSTARPILITSVSVFFRSGSAGSVKLSCSTSIGGGNYSSTSFTGGGEKIYAPNVAAFTGNTVYLGFQKQNSSDVLFYREATTTPQPASGTSGSIAQPSGINRDGGASSSTYNGTSLYAQASWAVVPNAPTITSTTSTASSITVNWSSPSSNGGSSITGYRILYKPTSSSTWSSTGKFTVRTSYTIEGLTESTNYDIRLAATNGVTDAHNSSYSSSSNHTGTNASATKQTESAAPADPVPQFSVTQGTWRVGVYSTETITANPATAISLIEFPGEELSTFGLSSVTSTSGTSKIITIYGTPTKSGTLGYNVTADNNTASDTLFEEIVIAQPNTPSWTDTQFNAAQSGESYSDSITASNAISVVVDSISIPGLSATVSGATVTLSGTPQVTTSQTYNINVTAYSATDNGVAKSKSATLSIYITRAVPPAWSDTSISSTAKIDNDYSDAVFAENATTYQVVSGSLPPGLSLNSGTGQISGKPTATGQYSFTIRASNNILSATPDQTLTIQVVFGGRNYSSSSGWNASITHARRWDGSDWVDISYARRWSGSSWVPLSR